MLNLPIYEFSVTLPDPKLDDPIEPEERTIVRGHFKNCVLCLACRLNDGMGGRQVNLGQDRSDVIAGVCNKPNNNGDRLFVVGRTNQSPDKHLSIPWCLRANGQLPEVLAKLSPKSEDE